MRAAGIGSLLLLAGAALVGPGRPAHAQGTDGPPLMPSRDVSVIYNVQPEGAPQPQPVHVYFRGGGGLMRVDGPPGPDGASQGQMIMDRTARVMTVVLNGPRIFMQIPEQDEVRSPFVLDASMHFTRTGTGTVAGVACTNWSIVTGKGNAVACVSADGVVLSESGVDGQGARGQLVAQTVQYGTLPPSLFVPPPGYQRTAHPENLGAGGNGGPGQGGPNLGGPVGRPPGMEPQGAPGPMPAGPAGTIPGQ